MRDLSVDDGHVDTSCRDPAIAPGRLSQMFSHMKEEPPWCHRYARKWQPVRVVREADVLQEIAEGDGDLYRMGTLPAIATTALVEVVEAETPVVVAAMMEMTRTT